MSRPVPDDWLQFTHIARPCMFQQQAFCRGRPSMQIPWRLSGRSEIGTGAAVCLRGGWSAAVGRSQRCHSTALNRYSATLGLLRQARHRTARLLSLDAATGRYGLLRGGMNPPKASPPFQYRCTNWRGLSGASSSLGYSSQRTPDQRTRTHQSKMPLLSSMATGTTRLVRAGASTRILKPLRQPGAHSLNRTRRRGLGRVTVW